MQTLRRSLLCGLSLAALAGPSIAGSLSLKGKAAAVFPNTLTVSGSTGGTAFGYAPAVRSATVWRTPQVAQDDEIIDLQAEVAPPWSPTATSWSVIGADTQYLAAAANGCLVFKAATRASIPKGAALSVSVIGFNAHGISPTSATLTIFVPNDTDCYFVDPVSGVDSNTGKWSHPWLHAPKSNSSTGVAASTTLAYPSVLFLKSATFRTTLATGGFDGTADALPHAGTADATRFVLTARGWGAGNAVVAGDVVIGNAGAGQATWQPYSGNIKQIDMSVGGGNGGAPGFSNTQASVPLVQAFYDDDTMLYPGQWPQPVDLRNNEDPVDVTGGQSSPKSGGMWQLTYTTNAGVDGVTYSGGNVTIRDARIAARYGNVAVTTLPLQVKLWVAGNNIRWFDLGGAGTTATYDFANSAVTFASAFAPETLAGPVTGGLTAYAFVGHPLDIVVSGQYALSPDRLTAYAWLTHNGVSSVARLVAGSVQGKFGATAGPNWITWTGLTFQRFTGNSVAIGRGGGACLGVTLSNIKIRQTWNQAEAASFMQLSSGSFNDGIIERISMEENPRSECIVGGASMWAANLTTPTAAQVRAYALAKIRWCYIPVFGVQRSSFQLNNAFGLGIYENVMDQINTVHGDCLPLYSPGTTATGVSTYNVVEYNFFNNCSRPVTVSLQDPTLQRFNTINANVFLSRDSYSYSTFGVGEPAGTFTRNILMNGPGGAANAIGSLDMGPGRGVTLLNNVIAGYGVVTPYLAAAGGNPLKYDIEFNLLTTSKTPPPNTDATAIYLSNTSTPAIGNVWDISLVPQIDPAWATALGAGQVGTFWAV